MALCIRLMLRPGVILINEVKKILDEQANDEGLWFIPATCPEAYLQQELKRLHETVGRFIETL